MKKVIVGLCVATLSMGTLGAAMVPAVAAPYNNNNDHRDHPRFESHGNYAYYNGHRGYKTRHSGYRYYNGYWFPPAAFIVGGLIFGGILGSIIAHNQH
jgi:hypothetical protein